MPRIAKHIHRELTPTERARVAGAREDAEREKDSIRRRAKELKQECDAASTSLETALQLLKQERMKQGLSLADVTERSGIDKPNLSRLENEAEANPTVATLSRYADALGKRFFVVLANK